MDQLIYQIALSLAHGVGPVKSRLLLSYCGSASEIITARPDVLNKIPEISWATIKELKNPDLLRKAEQEALFVANNNVSPLFFTDPHYPERLKHCADAPILIFTRGHINFNNSHVVSIVGTRAATSYGKAFCEQLVQALVPHSPLIVSGLAYGIDVCAHRASLKSGLSTVACLAHGLDRVYPALHSTVAREMLSSGGLVTEFVSGTRPDRELFPMRNRIIAGLADCTVVVETDERGGSMITAHLAHGYGRDVFALPGRHSDTHSKGCNQLIRRHVAAILTNPNDLAEYMNWQTGGATITSQTRLFEGLDPDEEEVVALLRASALGLDQIAIQTGRPVSQISSLLLNLEFRGVIHAAPGKVFHLEK